MNINEIRDLIGNGNLKDALAALFNAEEHLILKIKNELTLLKARLSSLQENEMLGLIDSESTKIERNKIVFSLLNLLDFLEQELKIQQQIPDIKTLSDDNPEKNNSNIANSNLNSKQPVNALLVYHPNDGVYADKLIAQLFPLKRAKRIDLFDVHKHVKATENKRLLWSNKLADARLVLVLFSANLYQAETLDFALEVENYVGKKAVVPIKINNFDLEETPFQPLQGLPRNGKPITEHNNIDSVMAEIAEEIKQILNSLEA
ncbi:MAG: hypothetical protein IPI59_13180 [Sphingobacteriales bacterium]|jgi:hypothetical protein|nr:hypothetical protein [Sphingobacteriales bacterium]MBP9140251.1 hypothetical protein [Chitinophagales bacterium]MDA0197615.1 hypothetical protein [Bacteroidota bacterium]MBK7528470.1 hypothetical protein [Sphingobacteriales bacterium]MBK8679565.1 hypothetical protein [Sphingobacteriales bacterium]